MIQKKYNLEDVYHKDIYRTPANEAEQRAREAACPPMDCCFLELHSAPLPTNGVKTTYLNDEDYIALSVARKAVWCGYAVRVISEHEIEVACESRVVEYFAELTYASRRAFTVWQYFGGPPKTLSNWRNQMRKYVTRRWYDSDHPLAGMMKIQGPNAGDPEMIPLLLIANVNGAWDLSDALTFSVWMDYLNEYPERAELWREFEAQYGVQEKLV